MISKSTNRIVITILTLTTFCFACNRSGKHILSPVEEEAMNIADTLRDLDEFVHYIDKFEKTGEKRAELFMRQKYGKTLRDRSMFEHAISQHDTCIRMAQELKDTIQIIIALNHQGTNFRRLGDMSEATDLHYKALELCDKIVEDTSSYAKLNKTRTYNGLGNVLLSLKNYDAAEGMFRRALKSETEANNSTGMAINLANLGSVKENNGDLDSALVYYKQSLEYNLCSNNTVGMSLCYMYIGKLAEKRGNIDEALKYYRKSYELGIPTGDAWHWLEPCLSLGMLYIKEDKTDSAKKYLEHGLETAYSIHSIDHLARYHDAFAKMHEKNGNHAQAVTDIHISQMFKDSVSLEKSQNHIQNLRVNYESNKAKMAEERAHNEKRVRQIVSASSIIIIFILLYAIFLHLRIIKARKKVIETNEKVAQERQEFYRGVTHQLRTPLTVVLGMTQQLRKYMPENDPLATREFDAVNRQCQHLLNLVTEMIQYSKHGTRTAPIVSELGTPNINSADDIPVSYITAENNSFVLLAEDDPDVALLITEMLKNEGYNYMWAKDGLEAWEMMNDNMPDILVTDIMMPRMDGLELMKKIREDESMCHLPIVVVSARVENEDRLIGIEAGAEVYLGKPFLPNELLLRVRKLLEQRQMLHDKFLSQIEMSGKAKRVAKVVAPLVEEVKITEEKNPEQKEPETTALTAPATTETTTTEKAEPDDKKADDTSNENDEKISSDAPQLSQKEQAFIDSVNELINKNMSNTEFSSATLAESLNTTLSTLNRKLKNITSIDTTHYIRMHRIAKAKDLLINTDKTMVEIQTECGFETPSYFSRTFKADVGVPPSEFRKNFG